MNSPINADGAEIEDAGSTHHHIQSDKDVTVDLAKAPLSHHLRDKNTIKWQLIVTVNTALRVPSRDKAQFFIYFLVCYQDLPSVRGWDSVRQAAAGILKLVVYIVRKAAATIMFFIYPPGISFDMTGQ